MWLKMSPEIRTSSPEVVGNGLETLHHEIAVAHEECAVAARNFAVFFDTLPDFDFDFLKPGVDDLGVAFAELGSEQSRRRGGECIRAGTCSRSTRACENPPADPR